MKELFEYRKKLVNRLDAASKEFRTTCLAVKDPYAPVEAGGWSVHQIAVHTRDVDKLVYGLRARRTLAEDNPEFPNFDSEAYMSAHYDPKESLLEVLDSFVANVGALVRLLGEMPLEGWSRISRHETQGSGLTFQVWVERGLEHIEEHLATVTRTK